MKDKLVKMTATFFGVGYLPFMPGTWGSLAGAGIFIITGYNAVLSTTIAVCLFFLGFYTSGKAEKCFGKKDDKKIVIDEVCGILLLYSLIPAGMPCIISGFILYRIFDILKPYPIKKLENIEGSAGIMLDDIVAALYSFTAITLFFMGR